MSENAVYNPELVKINESTIKAKKNVEFRDIVTIDNDKYGRVIKIIQGRHDKQLIVCRNFSSSNCIKCPAFLLCDGKIRGYERF